MSSSASEIKKATLDNQVATAIRRRIVEGTIEPGARITEMALAEEFELSRGTIRAALRQLMSEGLITQVPYTGWEVVPLSSKDAWELYTLRSALEALAARLAAVSISNQGTKQITQAMNLLVRACKKENAKLAAKADFDLHVTIIRLSGHSRLEEQYNQIARQVQRYIFSSDAILPDQSALVKQHQPMVDAILAGDKDKAESLAKAHNEEEGKAIVDHLRKQEDLTATTT